MAISWSRWLRSNRRRCKPHSERRIPNLSFAEQIGHNATGPRTAVCAQTSRDVTLYPGVFGYSCDCSNHARGDPAVEAEKRRGVDIAAHPSSSSHARKSKRDTPPHTVGSARSARPPARSGSSQYLQDPLRYRDQAVRVSLPSRASLLSGLVRVPRSSVSNPGNSSETVSLPFAYLLSPGCDSSVVRFHQPSMTVIAWGCLKSVSEGGGFITMRYLCWRFDAGLSGIQAHFMAGGSAIEGAPMAGGLRWIFKPYGLGSGPLWPLSSMPFSVTKTSEDTHSCSLPG